jgi:hypothetical protein
MAIARGIGLARCASSTASGILGAPESGVHRSSTVIGGDESSGTWCTPVLRSCSSHVRYLGPAGSGQAGGSALVELLEVSRVLTVDSARSNCST